MSLGSRHSVLDLQGRSRFAAAAALPALCGLVLWLCPLPVWGGTEEVKVTHTCATGPGPQVPDPAPFIPSGAWAGALDQHPRLLGPPEHLKTLARTKPEAYRALRQGESMLAVGIVRAVEGVDEERVQRFLDRAERNITRGTTNIHQDTWIWLTNMVSGGAGSGSGIRASSTDCGAAACFTGIV